MAATTSLVRLLVDGYNIIGAWRSLRKIRDRQSMDSARQHLIETLINYSAYQDYQTHIVFDSQYQRTPAQGECHTKSLYVYYTSFGQTADTHIERLCADFHRERGDGRIIVATSDRAQRNTVTGYGAHWLSADRLEAEVELVKRQWREKQRPKSNPSGRFLFNSLDPKAQELLTQLRHGRY